MFDFQEEEKIFVKNYLLSNISNITKHYDKWNIRCTICGDSKKSKRKKRGWYYLDTNSYYCFNEGCAASGLWVISKLFNIPIEEVKKEFISTIKHVDTSYNIPTSIESIPENIINIEKFLIPNNWVQLPIIAEEFLKSRKILEAPFLPIKNYKFYYNIKNNRLIIPWYKDNEIVYYQERSLNSSLPKYLFPSNMKKCITNLNNIDYNYKYIFITEGILDSIFIFNSIPIGGLLLTNSQSIELNRLALEKVYFFDNQWIDTASRKITLKIAKEIPNQKIFIWPKSIKDKDVNDFIINNDINPFINKDFLESRIMYGLKILLELKQF